MKEAVDKPNHWAIGIKEERLRKSHDIWNEFMFDEMAFTGIDVKDGIVVAVWEYRETP